LSKRHTTNRASTTTTGHHDTDTDRKTDKFVFAMFEHLVSVRKSDSPSFYKILPHVVPQPICTWKLLNEVLNRVLPKAEEVGARHGVGMLAVADKIRLLDDVGPRARRGAGDYGAVGDVGRDDLELGPIPAVQYCTVVDDLGVGINRGEITSIEIISVRT
jgi:hypothetical protein